MIREMKDSGIGWLGYVPVGWQIHRIANLYSERNESGSDELPILTVSINSGISDHEMDDEEQTRNFVRSDDKSKYKRVYPGDLAYNMMRAWQGAFGAVRTDGMISPAYVVAKPNKGISVDSRYMEALLRTPSAIEEMHRYSRGITDFRLRLYWPEFKKIQVCIPTVKEQKEIADYLDKKGACIDAVIEQTRNSIEEYKKLKQSIITEAVTHGVRGPRKMKDSGVEWIGEIPEEWECKPVKYVAVFQPSCDTAYLNEDSEITYLPMECLKNGYFISNTGIYSKLAVSLTPFSDGDIAMAKVTPCFENGNIAIVEGLHSGFGLGSSELFIYRPVSVVSQYMLYWLQNDLFKQAACATMTGTGGLKRVSPYFAKHCKMCVPSYEEQQQIVDSLTVKCAAINRLIESKLQLLAQLEAYKKSVIYEYVTGKKEV